MTIILQSINGLVFSKNSNHFILDENKLAIEFAGLNKLENFIEKNQGITLVEIENNHHYLLKGHHYLLKGIIANPNNFKGMERTLRGGETPLGIPPFIWGLCLGIVGLVLVAILAEEKELTKKALYGCIVGTAISLGLRFMFAFFDFSFIF